MDISDFNKSILTNDLRKLSDTEAHDTLNELQDHLINTNQIPTKIYGTGKGKLYWLINNYQLSIKDNDDFNYFFALKLKQTNIFNTYDFLSYHLDKTFNNDKSGFEDYLKLLFREYDYILHNRKLSNTVTEWIHETQIINKKDSRNKQVVSKTVVSRKTKNMSV